MVHSKKEIRRIGTTYSCEPETMLQIFLLQDCSEKTLDTSKSKINFWTKKDLESTRFKNKAKNSKTLMMNIFRNTEDIIRFIKKENDQIITVLLANAEIHNPSVMQEVLFGKTLYDKLRNLKTRHENDVVGCYKSARRILLEHKTLVEQCREEFRKEVNKKCIVTEEKPLSFAFIKSEMDNHLIRSIAHLTENIDILFHRRDKKSGNFISVNVGAEKYLRLIHEQLMIDELKENEASSGFWYRNNNIVYCDLGKISCLRFDKIVNVIENTIKEYGQPPKETAGDQPEKSISCPAEYVLASA